MCVFHDRHNVPTDQGPARHALYTHCGGEGRLTEIRACSASNRLTDSFGIPGDGNKRHGPESARQQQQRDADENLANHFASVQTISDTTTLPQMLEELERHLNRAASLDALILRLR